MTLALPISTLTEGFTALTGNDLRWRLRIKLSAFSTTTVDGTNIVQFSLRNASSQTLFAILVDSAGSGDVKVKGTATNDEGSASDIATAANISGSNEVCFEIRAIQEVSDGSDDGIAEFYIDGVSQGTVSNLGNYNRWNTGIDETFILFVDDANHSGDLYYDEWILDDDNAADLGCGVTTAFRFLNFAADTGTLMISGLKDAATLKLYDYDLDTLTESGTASFGAATDTELDDRDRGIFPVAKPMEDDVWMLYGRDGNNVQVQYNDRNGTLGWTDLGPGTATWGTAKYAVALMAEPTLTDDIIVAFDDDDVYRTRFGTMTWVKMGDASSGLRVGARHIANRFNEIILAGTVAGTVLYSPNFGASYADVSGTALGTVNAIEVSL